MTLSISQPHSISLTTEDAALQEALYELQVTIASLQRLVCELLVKNQQLRFQQEEGCVTLNN